MTEQTKESIIEVSCILTSIALFIGVFTMMHFTQEKFREKQLARCETLLHLYTYKTEAKNPFVVATYKKNTKEEINQWCKIRQQSSFRYDLKSTLEGLEREVQSL